MELILLCIGTVLACGGGVAMLCMASEEIGESFPKRACLLMISCNVILTATLGRQGDAAVLPALKYLTLMTVLFVCAWTDYRKYQILNRILIVALLLCIGWLAAGFWICWEEFVHSIMSAAIAAGLLGLGSLLCKLVSRDGVGFGDVKLLIVFGLFAGIDMSIETIVYTFLVMFAVFVILLLLGKVKRQSMIPFAPFLYIGSVIYAFTAGI